MVTPALGRRAPAPDLVVTAVTNPPASVAEGAAFAVRDTVRNRGRGKGKASATRYYLSRNARGSLAERRASKSNPRMAVGDIRLAGARRVPGLRPRRASAPRPRRTTAVRVPIGTPTGLYYLLACADDRGAVREANEANNCRAAKRKVQVTALAGARLRVGAFSDSRQQPDLEADQEALEFSRFMCAPASGRRVASPAAAVVSLERMLTKTAGADAMAAFRGSASYRSADAAQRAAGAALAADSPGAALAALLRAHRLEPRNPAHLLNAASVATAVGQPAEALALLDGAARLDDPGPPAMGISRQAAAAANRAQALAGLGRFREAEAAAQAAQRLEPLLSEATSTEAHASNCLRKPAVNVLRRSRYRQNPPPDPPVDESQGRESRLRSLALPTTPSEAADFRPIFYQQLLRLSPELAARQDREDELRERVGVKKVSSATWNRRESLLEIVEKIEQRPAMLALERVVHDRLADATDVSHEMWCGPDGCDDTTYGRLRAAAFDACENQSNFDACLLFETKSRCVPALKLAHQGWLNAMKAAYAAGQRYHGAVSKAISGTASHLSDADAYAFALIAVEDNEWGVMSNLLAAGHNWTIPVSNHENQCIGELGEPPSEEDPGAPTPNAAGPCPPGLKALKGALDLEIVTIKVNCEEVSVEGATPGWIGAFAEVTWAPRSGKVTVFAGAKAGVGIGVKGELKSGFYFTQSNTSLTSGEITDVGWRVATEATIGAGPIEYSAGGETMDFTFVGAFSAEM